MRRGNLFFVALISATITFISLNMVFGRPGYYYERYPHYNRYHHYYDRQYDKDYQRNHESKNDSVNSNY